MTDIGLDPFRAAATPGRSYSSVFGPAIRWFRRVHGAREDFGELHRLSDHMLRDVGLMRDQIDGVLRGMIR